MKHFNGEQQLQKYDDDDDERRRRQHVLKTNEADTTISANNNSSIQISKQNHSNNDNVDNRILTGTNALQSNNITNELSGIDKLNDKGEESEEAIIA